MLLRKIPGDDIEQKDILIWMFQHIQVTLCSVQFSINSFMLNDFGVLGCYDEHLCCWRTYGNSLFDELRRYFIGSSAELDDLSAIAIPHMYRHEKVHFSSNEKFKMILKSILIEKNTFQSFWFSNNINW